MRPETVAGKMTRARTQLLLNQPFFGALCLRLKLLPGPVRTMATDGKHILYSPAFVESLQPSEVEAVLAHEVMHVALAHHCRRGERDRRMWNEAADFAINPILIGNGFTLPAGALVDASFDNLGAEEIYSRLLQRRGGADSVQHQSPPPQAVGGGSIPHQGVPSASLPNTQGSETVGGQPDHHAADGEGDSTEDASGESRPSGFGEVVDATDDEGKPASPAERSRQQHDWSIAADQAMRAAKVCGHEPANVARPLEESRQSRQDWRSILRDFIMSTTPSDYRWTPPNRRHIASGLYLPSVDRTGLGTVVIAVDTSGSIGLRELEQFGGEISAIVNEAKPETIHVVYCDAAVQSSQEFGPSEPLHLEPNGGGGTDFRPVFDWVVENGILPACLIYLTDLCCHSFPDPPEYPVLWATDSRVTAPFGETVLISVD